jgi:hypothetical protein
VKKVIEKKNDFNKHLLIVSMLLSERMVLTLNFRLRKEVFCLKEENHFREIKK